MRLAVFASGGGSNFEAIVRAKESGDLNASIELVVANRPDAGVLERAHAHAIPTTVIRPEDFDSPAEYAEHLLRLLDTRHVDFIALAGYLKKIPPSVVGRFRHRMVNIHPALLPSFGGRGLYGQRVHKAVLDYGVRWTGVTVHLVDDEYDTGPIVLQEPVPVHQGDTVEALAARVLAVEHRLYPDALQLFADNRITIDGRRVTIHEASQ